jgi:transposase
VENVVVDSSSSEVNRRHRRAQTDRLEVHHRPPMLLRDGAGEQRVWSSVRVPSMEDEHRRPLHRALATTTRERTRVITRITGRLASPGLVMPPSGDCQPQLAFLRLWDGAPLPSRLRPRLGQEWEPGPAWAQRLGQVAAERRMCRQTAAEAVRQKVRHLLTLKGMGPTRAWGFVLECFGGRAFRHGNAGGALSGLPPTP